MFCEALDSPADVQSVAPPAPPAPPTDDDKLMKVISIQRFDGSFKSDEALAQLLNVTFDAINQGFHFFSSTDNDDFSTFSFLAGRDAGYIESVWITVVALAYLSLVLSQLQDSWTLVATKAEKWLVSQQLDNLEQAKKDAGDFVKAKLNI